MTAKDDDIGSTEYWRDIKRARQKKRADNRENAATYLRERLIPFTKKNFGAHLIVEGRGCFIDFWPGTGKWRHFRSGKKGFGVRNLVEYITAPSNAELCIQTEEAWEINYTE
jgi:hypothetical protein